jgi:hypothetical protein
MLPFAARLRPALAVVSLLIGAALVASNADGQELAALASQFAAPPEAAKPWLWWHWMNGNISSPGITKDLEAFKAAGFGGVILFEEANRIGPGPVRYFSPEHFGFITQAGREAARLGLKFGFHNSPGWSSAGGPWVTPEYAMKHVTWSETTLLGGAHATARLPRPSTTVRPYAKLGPPDRYLREDYYRDVAVLAFPTPTDPNWRLEHAAEKAGFIATYRQAAQRNDAPAGVAINPRSILDVSNHLRDDGVLDWDVPPGDWTVLRFGYTLTEHTNRAVPTTGALGLECDKFSTEAVDFYWREFDARILQAAENGAAAKVDTVLMDSYEPLTQTWTPRMPEDFQRLRSYALLNYLPCLTGRVVGSVAETERFLWDYRRTLADLGTENYYGRFLARCHERGLTLAAECYGFYGSFFDEFSVNRLVDVPMGEFWAGTGKSKWTIWTPKLAASGADLSGHHVVGAEAFTAGWDMAAWKRHPYALKAEGDYFFCRGINRFYIQAGVHQPWPDSIQPGMTFGPHGIQMNRNNTWFAASRGWLGYLSRCQFLLQQGQLVADVYFDYGDNAPATLWPKDERGPDWETWNPDEDRSPNMWTSIPHGRDFHVGNGSIVRQMRVNPGGELSLPDGQTYRLLLLPDDDRMDPGLTQHIAELVAAGATVVGPKPHSSPTLTGGIAASEEVAQLGRKVWGDVDGHAITSHVFGKGRVWYGVGLEDVFRQQGLAVDFEYRDRQGTSGPAPRLDYIHRRLADAEFYFVTNQRQASADVVCTFRTHGRRPELWWPETGSIEPVNGWESTPDGRTSLRLELGPAESCFVMFRPNAKGVLPLRRFTRDGTDVGRTDAGLDREGRDWQLTAWSSGTYETEPADGTTRRTTVASLPPPLDLSGDWDIQFQPSRGAPPAAHMAQLASWTSNDVEGIKFFSGTATYTKTLSIGPEQRGCAGILDLGDVQVIAEVSVNGHEAAVLWKPPFRCDITRLLQPGTNVLSIKVTNLWRNRLIGDAQIRGLAAAQSDVQTHLPFYLVPDWLKVDRPNPDPRVTTFTLFDFMHAGMPLEPSGLLGPVTLRFGRHVAFP